MTVQRDFGGFDPAFLGITLRFSNERTWRFFTEFRKSPTPLPINSLPSNEQFEALATASVVSHEARHYHDFLLTSYSAHLFSYRIQLLMNALQLLPHMFSDDANCLPVPVTRWCRLDDAQRLRQLTWLPARPDSTPWKPLSLPKVTTDDAVPHATIEATGDNLAGLIRVVRRLQDRIGDLVSNPASTGSAQILQLEPWQVFELSGLVIQIQDIWLTYGEDEANLFIKSLGTSNPYTRMLNVVLHMWDVAGLASQWNLTAAVVAWSLLGSYAKDGWSACPTERFARLFVHITKNGLESGVNSFEGLFEKWSTRLGVSTVGEGIDDAAATFHRASDLLARGMSLLDRTFVAEDAATVHRVTTGVAAASDHMGAAFREAPERYTDPTLYLESVDRFANPILRVAAGGGFGLRNELSEEEMKRRGFVTHWAVREAAGPLVLSRVEPFDVSPFARLNPVDVMRVCDLIGIVDFLAGETCRAREDVQFIGRVYFSESGASPFELF